MSETNDITDVAYVNNVAWLTDRREDTARAASILRYVALGEHGKAVGLPVLRSKYDRAVVGLAAANKGRWLAYGNRTMVNSLADYLYLPRAEVSRSLARLRREGLVVVDQTTSGIPRLSIFTPKMMAAVGEIEFRTTMARCVRPDDLAKIVKSIGWDELALRLRTTLEDPDRGLDVDRKRDREMAWEIVISMGPKSWAVRW